MELVLFLSYFRFRFYLFYLLIFFFEFIFDLNEIF